MGGAWLLFTDPATRPQRAHVRRAHRPAFAFRLLDPSSPVAAARVVPSGATCGTAARTTGSCRQASTPSRPDYRPIIGPAGVEGLFVNTGYSGHGIMLSVAGARILAETLLDPSGASPPRPFRASTARSNRSLDPHAVASTAWIACMGAIAAAVTPLHDGGAALDASSIAGLPPSSRREGSTASSCAARRERACSCPRTNGRQRHGVVPLRTYRPRVPVAVHAGAQTTAATCASPRTHATPAPTPWRSSPRRTSRWIDDALTHHFVAAARACDPLPFYVYEFAARSGYPIAARGRGARASRGAEPRGDEGVRHALGRGASRTWAWGSTCSSARNRWCGTAWRPGAAARSAGSRPLSPSRRRHSYTTSPSRAHTGRQ